MVGRSALTYSEIMLFYPCQNRRSKAIFFCLKCVLDPKQIIPWFWSKNKLKLLHWNKILQRVTYWCQNVKQMISTKLLMMGDDLYIRQSVSPTASNRLTKHQLFLRPSIRWSVFSLHSGIKIKNICLYHHSVWWDSATMKSTWEQKPTKGKSRFMTFILPLTPDVCR